MQKSKKRKRTKKREAYDPFAGDTSEEDSPESEP
jgi:hypothetical protein